MAIRYAIARIEVCSGEHQGYVSLSLWEPIGLKARPLYWDNPNNADKVCSALNETKLLDEIRYEVETWD